MGAMKKAAMAAVIVGGFALGAAANAASFLFTAGAASPSGGFTMMDTFDTAAGLTGSNFQILTPPASSAGSPPANSVPSGTSYLSVQAGGSATYTFSGAVSSFQFDWGSIDDYNTLTFFSNMGGEVVVPGSDFTNPADGNRVSPGTNGLFTVTGDAGEYFTTVTFASGKNSFEVDNLAGISASAVPEPASWAMMISGFGLVGSGLRRRRASGNRAFA